MLDFVGEQSKRLNRSLSKSDQARVDEYFTSVRELEQRLHSSEEWEHRPKPVVASKVPDDIDDQREFVVKTRLMFDVMKLALETDSTRIISLFGTRRSSTKSPTTATGPKSSPTCARRRRRSSTRSRRFFPRSPRRRKAVRRYSTARWSSTARRWAARIRTAT